jgi:predicted alpha/beta superfamily hydrolase
MRSLSLKKPFERAMFIILLLFAYAANAQKTESIKADPREIVTIHSGILNEDRRIIIYHPPKDAAQPDKAYPVLYVLDADNHANMMAEYCQYLSRYDVNVMPPMIVVGITNTDRTRDLTPSHTIIDYFGKADTSATSWLRSSGGNEQFFKFIQTELMPYVTSHYKTQPYRIFAGHSFGGITAINCLINYPNMFDAYIAVSPSFWWDRKYLLKLAVKKLKAGSTLAKTLFFSDGNEGLSDGSTFHTNVVTFDSLLKKRAINGLESQYVYYPAESHMTVPVKSYYDGLRFIFRQWEFPLMDNKKVNAEILMNHYNAISQKFGYKILPDEDNIANWAGWMINDPETWPNAVSLLELNTQNYPSSEKAFVKLGEAFEKTGNKQKAITAYRKAGALNPASVEIKSKLQTLQKP